MCIIALKEMFVVYKDYIYWGKLAQVHNIILILFSSPTPPLVFLLPLIPGLLLIFKSCILSLCFLSVLFSPTHFPPLLLSLHLLFPHPCEKTFPTFICLLLWFSFVYFFQRLSSQISRHFSEEAQMTTKCMKKFSTFLAIREVQLNTTLRYHLTKERTAIIKETNKC